MTENIPLEPFDSGYLAVGDGHEVYYEQSGNPDGVPVIHLHGGPGDGSRPNNRNLYDPQQYRLIQLDQRGAGRSKPAASIEHNTTQDLISDIEKLREWLGVDTWLVAGGSWGSYLGLVYAIAHLSRCRGLVLRGILLGYREQIDWWFSGRSVLFPDGYEDFANFVPEAERGDLAKAYYVRLRDPDPAVHIPATVSLRNFMVPMKSVGGSDAAIPPINMQHALNVARLWTHYCANSFFFAEGYILDNIAALKKLPAIIVQGRYDIVTPMRDAYRLHQAWPEAEFVVVSNGGHATDDPSIAAALSAANRRIFARLPTP